MQDLQGRFFEEFDRVAYIGFDSKIHIGEAVIKEKRLVLWLENKKGFSELGRGCLIIN